MWFFYNATTDDTTVPPEAIDIENCDRAQRHVCGTPSNHYNQNIYSWVLISQLVI